MKAVRFSQFGGPEVLEIADLPDPHPGPGQVRIAVRAANLPRYNHCEEAVMAGRLLDIPSDVPGKEIA